MKVGMVLGKFLPPHLGHQYLLRFARGLVDRLYVVVEKIEGETIPSALRCQWVQTLHPDCQVLHLEQTMPQTPEAHPQFWSHWRQVLQALLPEPPQWVFASESYGHRLAAELGAKFFPADPGRTAMQIRATQIREDPYLYWRYLPAPVRAFYAKRVCVFGPESTGKSTLCQNLAQVFNTVWVPEYARTYLEAHGRDPVFEDMWKIGRGQLASEAALAGEAERVLICDTDLLTTTLWSDILFGRVDPELSAAALTQNYDLTLLCDVDVPWVPDAVRYFPEERRAFFERCEVLLRQAGRRYLPIRGDWATRTATAQNAILGLFSGASWLP